MHGFSSDMIPDARKKFGASFGKHWPKLVNSVATELLAGQKYGGSDLSKSFRVAALDPIAEKDVQGRLFETVLKGMSRRTFQRTRDRT